MVREAERFKRTSVAEKLKVDYSVEGSIYYRALKGDNALHPLTPPQTNAESPHSLDRPFQTTHPEKLQYVK